MELVSYLEHKLDAITNVRLLISDNEILYRNDNGHIVLYDVLKGQAQVLLEGNFPVSNFRGWQHYSNKR